jgi:hypothetical protein
VSGGTGYNKYSLIVTPCNIYHNYLLQNNPDSFSELKSLLSTYSASSMRSNAQTLTYALSSSLQRLRYAASWLLFDLCITRVERLLQNYTLDDVIVTSLSDNAGDITGRLLEQYLPQSLITQVKFLPLLFFNFKLFSISF